jgi:hypothetical protein
MGPQTLIWAVAVVVARCGPPAGKPSRALVFRSRCRSRAARILDWVVDLRYRQQA